MKNKQLNTTESARSRELIDAALKISAIALLILWCFNIVAPFLLPIMWGATIAVAVYPFYNKMVNWLNGNKKLAAILFSIVGITLLVLPTIIFSGSAIDSIQHISQALQEGTLSIPPPPENINSWPIIGDDLFSIWLNASQNIKGLVSQYPEQIKSTLTVFLSAAASFGGVIIQFIVAIIVAAAFMSKAAFCSDICHKILHKFLGDFASQSLATSVATIRSVAQGILGIAFTQALLAGAGLVLADIPGAGIWVLLVLLVAIIQLPPIIILGPIAAYYFTVAETTPAVIFLIWCIAVSISDAFLKPLLLGRGLDIPMLVILMGAIGGLILSGIIGLFVGALVLALGYQMLIIWVEKTPIPTEETE